MKKLKINPIDRIPEAELITDPSAAYQEIDGFGMNINPLYWEDGALIPVMEIFHNDLEANLYRLDVYGQSNWIDPDSKSDKSILNEETYKRVYTSAPFQNAWKMARYLNEHGIKPYLNASGIVPAWMCAEDGATLQDYAAFSEMMASMLHWARHEEQIDFQLFGPLNETDIGPPEGPKLDGEQYTHCCEVLVDVLDRWGLSDVKLVVAEQAYFNLNFSTALLNSKKLVGRIAVIGMHTYSDRRYSAISEQLQNYEDKSTRFWMTEYGDLDVSGEFEWEVAWKSTDRLITFLQDGAQAGLVWDAYDNYHDHDKAWSLYGLLRRGRHEYTPKKRYYAAKQAYKFVKAGSVRISLNSDNQNIHAVAFNHSEHGITIVGMNKADQALKLNIRLPGSVQQAVKGYFTNESLNCAHMGSYCPEQDLLSVLVPAKTIFTFAQSRV